MSELPRSAARVTSSGRSRACTRTAAATESAVTGRMNPTRDSLDPLKTDQLDDLDRGLVHALQINGRAPFGVIAAALGVSDHTIARRYRRLRSQGAVRVVGVPDRRPPPSPTAPSSARKPPQAAGPSPCCAHSQPWSLCARAHRCRTGREAILSAGTTPYIPPWFRRWRPIAVGGASVRSGHVAPRTRTNLVSCATRPLETSLCAVGTQRTRPCAPQGQDA